MLDLGLKLHSRSRSAKILHQRFFLSIFRFHQTCKFERCSTNWLNACDMQFQNWNANNPICQWYLQQISFDTKYHHLIPWIPWISTGAVAEWWGGNPQRGFLGGFHRLGCELDVKGWSPYFWVFAKRGKPFFFVGNVEVGCWKLWTNHSNYFKLEGIWEVFACPESLRKGLKSSLVIKSQMIRIYQEYGIHVLNSDTRYSVSSSIIVLEHLVQTSYLYPSLHIHILQLRTRTTFCQTVSKIDSTGIAMYCLHDETKQLRDQWGLEPKCRGSAEVHRRDMHDLGDFFRQLS